MLKSNSKPTWKDAGGYSGLGGAPPPLPTNRAKGDIYPSRGRGRGKTNGGRGGESISRGRGGVRGRGGQRGKQRHSGSNISNDNIRQDTPALYNNSEVDTNGNSPPTYEEAISEKANLGIDTGLKNASVPEENSTSPSTNYPTESNRMPFSLTQSAAFRDGELNKSYDFAKDEVGKSREFSQVNEEEEIESEEEIDAHKYFEELISENLSENEELISENETTASTIMAGESKMDDFSPMSVFTWVGRKQGVRNVDKSLKLTLKDAKTIFPPGTLYSMAEDYDTYQRGGLYPLFHISEDSGTIDKIQESDTQIDPEEMGSQYMLDQGLFEEVARVTPSMAGSSNIELALAITSYKSMERDLSPKLIKEWKSWTGSRAFIQDLEENGLDCHAVRFFVKKAPVIDPHEDNDYFSYVLITEVIIRSPRDKIALIDAMQRFRVERWFGYQTVYVKHQ